MPTEVTEKALLAEIIRKLDGVIFAGGLASGGFNVAAECSCQNCGCDSRAGDHCGCNERCSCQGHTASQLDWAINVMLGAAAHVPLTELKGLIELREKIKAARAKATE